MFETTYSTADGRRMRGGMAFDSLSHARNGVFMTKGGSMVTRKDWPKFIARDDLPSTHTGLPTPELSASERAELEDHEHAKEACNAFEHALDKLKGKMHPVAYRTLLKLVGEHRRPEWEKGSAEDSD